MLGRTYLRGNHAFLKALVEEEPPKTQKDKQRYIVVLNFQTRSESLHLTVELWEIDPERLAQVLWVGNAPSNNPQDRLTTNTVAYLSSQAVPNLVSKLPEGDFRQRLAALLDKAYLDLGEKEKVSGSTQGEAQYERYRRMWDLTGMGIAGLDLLSGQRDRKEVEEICTKSGAEFLSRAFLQEFVRRRGKAAEAVKLVGKVLEAWVQKQLGLKRDQIAVYTLKLDGELLTQNPDYHRHLEGYLLEDLFEGSPTGRCHICGSEAPLTQDTTRFRLLKFYITDKLGFASGLYDKNFFKNYALCRECYRALLAGERFVEAHLRTRIARSSVYVIPIFHLPEAQPAASKLERWANYLQERLAATQTLEAWQKFQEKLQDYQEFEDVKGSFVLNFLFAEKSKSAVKVQRLIPDVPPSRLDRLDEVRANTQRFAELHFGSSNQWDLSFGRMVYLFPIRQGAGGIHNESFLEFLDALLTVRPIALKGLIPQFLETARVHRFEHYGTYVQSRPSADGSAATDAALTAFLVQSQLLLRYLKELGQLHGLSQGGEIMPMEQEAVPEGIREYLNDLGLSQGQRALFLLGYLIGQIASTRAQRESGKPILNKVHFQGMDRGKVIRLANEVYEKLRQYKITDYNEGLYATMKGLLDREHASLSSPQENTYWLLSGYAYATWQAIRAAKEKKEAQQQEKETMEVRS